MRNSFNKEDKWFYVSSYAFPPKLPPILSGGAGAPLAPLAVPYQSLITACVRVKFLTPLHFIAEFGEKGMSAVW